MSRRWPGPLNQDVRRLRVDVPVNHVYACSRCRTPCRILPRVRVTMARRRRESRGRLSRSASIWDETLR